MKAIAERKIEEIKKNFKDEHGVELGSLAATVKAEKEAEVAMERVIAVAKVNVLKDCLTELRTKNAERDLEY